MVLPVTPAELLSRQRESRRGDLATNQIIPLIYGETVVRGHIGPIGRYTSTTWAMLFLWGHGPLNYIKNVKLNNEDPTAGTTITNYLGTDTQEADPSLVAAITNYRDSLPGIAYSVVRFDESDYGTIPRVTAEIAGKMGTENPATAFADAVSRKRGAEYDEDEIEDAEDYCNELLGTEPRCRIGLVISSPLLFEELLEVLAEYCDGWALQKDGKWTIAIDKARSVDKTFTEGDWLREGFSIQSIELAQAPNRVDLLYTDIVDGVVLQTEPARAETYNAANGLEDLRINNVSMEGVTRYFEAKRKADLRLAKLRSQPFTIQGTDRLLSVHRGSRIQGTYKGTTYDMRVVGVPERSANGMVTLECIAYDASVYSNIVQTRPAYTQGGVIYE